MMKKNQPAFLIFVLCIFSLTNWAIAQKQIDLAQIKQVENGLSNYHQIKGEPTWNILERMEHYDVPGLSIAVIQDYQLAWTKTYGVVDKVSKEPVTENTLFQAASISKPISAYAALSLVEEGQLNLEANVNDFLTSWQVPDNEFTKEEQVNLKHIISHKAGLTVHGFRGYSPDLAVPTLTQLLDGKSPANSSAVRVDKVPGGKMRYSGGGYCVLQQVMIDVTDKTFPNILQERVLGPIGMTKSTFAQPLAPQQLKYAATGYVPNGSMTKGKRHTYPEMAAAGLWTNAAELAKFVIDLQQTLKGNSEKVLSKEMAQKMITPVEEDFLGLGIFLKDGSFEHGGWNEGFSSDMTGHIEAGYGVVIMINANQPPLLKEVFNSVARVYEWENSGPSPIKQLPYSKEELTQILGKYDAGFLKVFTVFQEKEKVFIKANNMGTQELVKVAQNKYIIRAHKTPIQFLNSPENEALSLVFITKKEPLDYTHQKQKIDSAFWLGILVVGSCLFMLYRKRFKNKKIS